MQENKLLVMPETRPEMNQKETDKEAPWVRLGFLCLASSETRIRAEEERVIMVTTR